ncbi:hypothetical protein MTO96_001649 [Rhipicephalus appendiculatus]
MIPPLQQYPDNMKRSACRKHADAEGKFSPTKPSVFIADDMVSSSITKLSTSTTRRSSALSSCRLTPIKEESQARPSAPGDTLHQSLGATGSGENLSHVYLVSPRPSSQRERVQVDHLTAVPVLDALPRMKKQLLDQ